MTTQQPSHTPSLRLNRYLASLGHDISRRGADQLIADGRVCINGQVADLGSRVDPMHDTVSIDGSPVTTIRKKPSATVLAYHKPRGIECTARRDIARNILEAVNFPERLFTIGRLDKDSDGLILLTNDGDLAYQVGHARFCHEKEYVVETRDCLPDEVLTQLAAGVTLDDGRTRPCQVQRIHKASFRIILTEGRNRQIRRMVEAVGHRVKRLHRTRVGSIRLGELPCGRWRHLSHAELSHLRRQSH